MSEWQSVRVELEALRALVLRLSSGAERQRLYEFRDAARLLGVSSKTISRMVAIGELAPTRIRNKRLISIEEIDRVSRPPSMASSGATSERTRFDGAAAMAKLKALRKKA